MYGVRQESKQTSGNDIKKGGIDNLNEDSLLDEAVFDDDNVPVMYKLEESSADGVKEDVKKLMTESGTLLIEKKTVNQQIDEILQLDERDPIRKLQDLFKGTYYGHEFAEDGTRLPVKYKAPKHKNFVMQRIENRKRMERERQMAK